MDEKKLLDKFKHKKEAQRRWKQIHVAWEEEGGEIIRAARVLVENAKVVLLVIKGRQGKMWALSVRKQDIWLTRTWRSQRYLITFFLPWSFPTRFPAI